MMDNLGGDVSEKRVLVRGPWDVNLKIIDQRLVLTGHVNIQCSSLSPVTLIANAVVGWEERKAEWISLLADHDEPVALNGELATIALCPIGANRCCLVCSWRWQRSAFRQSNLIIFVS